MIKTLEFLSPAECRAIIDAAERRGFLRSKIYNAKKDAIFSARRVSRTATMQDDAPMAGLKVLKKACEAIVRSHYGVNLSAWSGLAVNKYESGDYYLAHVDASPGETNHRAFTCVTFLNDHFKGGELIFPTRKITVSPVAGRSVFFSAVELHMSAPLREGVKYSLVNWLLFPSFDFS